MIILIVVIVVLIILVIKHRGIFKDYQNTFKLV
jgi:hypothetical protein